MTWPRGGAFDLLFNFDPAYPPLCPSSSNTGALEDFDHLEEEERNRATANAAAAAAAAAAGPATDSSAAPSSAPPPGAEQKEGDGEGEEDDADLDNLPPELMDGLKKLVEELSINKEGGAGVPGDLGLGSEEMMKEALEQLEGSPEFASIMEKMMGSLLSKEVLYEPIKQMKEKVRLHSSLRSCELLSLVCACACACAHVWWCVLRASCLCCAFTRCTDSLCCSTRPGWPTTETRCRQKSSPGEMPCLPPLSAVPVTLTPRTFQWSSGIQSSSSTSSVCACSTRATVAWPRS